MAIGKTRYTQDSRFTPLHEEGNDVWALKIQNTRFEDAGQYECQVSYHDDMEKKMKKPVRLVVLGELSHVSLSQKSVVLIRPILLLHILTQFKLWLEALLFEVFERTELSTFHGLFRFPEA